MQDQQLAEKQLFNQSEQLTHYLHDWIGFKPKVIQVNHLQNDIPIQKRSRSNLQRKYGKVAQLCQVHFPIIQKSSQSSKNLHMPPLQRKRNEGGYHIRSLSKLPIFRKISEQEEEENQKILVLKSNSIEAEESVILKKKKLKRRKKSKQIGLSKMDEELNIEKLKDIVLQQLSKNKNIHRRQN